jgi:LmbE family N-acetylglucosaminyl deacetylase
MGAAEAFLAALAVGDEPVPARVLVLAAHADDETVGLGGQFARLPNATILHVTDGAPRDGRDAAAHGFASTRDYAAARRRELEAALRLAGVAPERARGLGLPDQEAALHLAPLACRVAEVVTRERPAILVTHPFEGAHPDHDAVAFAAHAAARLLRRAGEEVPALIEMTSYHMGPAGIETGRFLPAAGRVEATIALPEEARARKRRMLDCFTTQRDVLRYFAADVERFRPAPRHRFAEPPHDGTLFYEHFPWGMTGGRFRRLAAEALRALGLGDGA